MFYRRQLQISKNQEIHQSLEKITRFDQKVKVLRVLLSHELLSKNILHINLHIYLLGVFNSRQIQKSKNYENPISTSKVIKKTRLNSWKNIIFI